MLSIGSPYATLEKYTNGRDDYYTRTAGNWAGPGAERLGLQGEVLNEQFSELRTGGLRGEVLVEPGPGGKHRDGWDLTFTESKSASMMRQYGGTEVREAIDRARARALDRTLDYIGWEYVYVRETHDGVTELQHGQAVFATFGHDLARGGELGADPNAHAHCVLLNVAYNANTDKWQAIETSPIYDAKIYLGQYYRNEAAREIQKELRDLGYQVPLEVRPDGTYDLAMFNQAEIEEFSQGKKRIDEAVARIKEKYPNMSRAEAREKANLDTRPEKDLISDPAVIQAKLQERGQVLGLTPETVRDRMELATERTREQGPQQVMTPDNIIRQAVEIAESREERWTREQVLQTAGVLSVGQHTVAELDAALRVQEAAGEIVRLGETRTREGGRVPWYTSREMNELSRGILDQARAGQNQAEPIMTAEQARAAVDGYEQERRAENPKFALTQGQREAAEFVLANPHTISGIQGAAGAGKTTMLEAVRIEAEAQGWELKGLCPTGKAAAEMEAASGIKSQTVDSFLLEKLRQEAAQEPGKKQVWIVDEMSMSGTRKTAEIIDTAREAGAKLILMGDTRQLQSIDAGRVHSVLQESGAMPHVRMDENIRQRRSPEYQQAVRDLAERRIDRAFDRAEKNGKIIEIADRDERLGRLVSEYTSQKNHKKDIINTPLNADRNYLNSQIRETLKGQGRLNGQDQAFTVRANKNLSEMDKRFAQSYERGDLVTANNFQVFKGEGRVIDKDEIRHRITVMDRGGREHEVDLRSHGTNLTVYEEKEQVFCKGDKLVFLKNDKGLKVQNGHTGIIREIDDRGRITVRMENGRDKHLNVATQYNYVDHGYAVTVHKSQGQTADRAAGRVYIDASKAMDYNTLYTAMTRGKGHAIIYTTDKQALREEAKNEIVKTHVTDLDKTPEQTQGREQERGQQPERDYDRELPELTQERGEGADLNAERGPEGFTSEPDRAAGEEMAHDQEQQHEEQTISHDNDRENDQSQDLDLSL